MGRLRVRRKLNGEEIGYVLTGNTETEVLADNFRIARYIPKDPKSIQNQHTTIEALLSTTPFLNSGRWLLCGLSDFSATRQVIATYKLLVTRVRLPAVFELSK